MAKYRIHVKPDGSVKAQALVGAKGTPPLVFSATASDVADLRVKMLELAQKVEVVRPTRAKANKALHELTGDPKESE